MKSDTLCDYYQVDDSDQPLKLAVDIGYGQNAVSKILIGKRMVPGPMSDGSFVRSFEKILGTNRELSGKSLQMTTLVLYNAKNPNGTSIVISLTGGITQYANKLETNIAEKGGVVKYSVRILFQ